MGCMLALGVLGLMGCGGGGGGGGSAPGSAPGVTDDGALVLLITDAPVDTVTEVWVGITVKPRGGTELSFEYDEPQQVDLLALTGANTASLLNGETLAAGEYNWIRLEVNADEDGTFDSYVMTDAGGMVELEVTSQTGLKMVSGFTIPVRQTASFIIDWDLRKGLTGPRGPGGAVWRLRPALRITDLNTFGSVSGTVMDDLLMAEGCTNDLAEDVGNSVYLFAGDGVAPADIFLEETDPLVTAAVQQDENGIYRFSATFLPPGDYTAAFTCQALDDTADGDEDLVFDEVIGLVVSDGEVTHVEFGMDG